MAHPLSPAILAALDHRTAATPASWRMSGRTARHGAITCAICSLGSSSREETTRGPVDHDYRLDPGPTHGPGLGTRLRRSSSSVIAG